MAIYHLRKLEMDKKNKTSQKRATVSDTEKKLSRIKEKIIDNYGYLLKPFFILLFIYLFVVYPIVSVNFNYLDDLGRTYYGYRGWYDFSRYISEYLSVFIHAGKRLTDISPLPQIIAVLFVVLSSVIILHLFKKDKKITFLNLIAVLPLGLSPFFLECLSYKFDAPYMALSILASVFPFLFYGDTKKKKIIFSISVLLGSLVMCMTYQAASGIILLMSLFMAFNLWNQKEPKEAFQFLIITWGSFLLGLIIFRVFFMVPHEAHASTSIFPIKELIPGFFRHLFEFYKYSVESFRNFWIILLFGIVIIFMIKKVKESKHSKIVALLGVTALLIISAIVTFGVYPALQNPYSLGKPYIPMRAMYGVGAFIALISVNATNGKGNGISKLLVFAFCWCLVTFVFTYGNALAEQKRYIDFRVQSVVNELNQMDIMNNSTLKTIKFEGEIGKSPVIEQLPEDYRRIIDRLVQQSFGGNWYWNEVYFLNYFGIKNIKIAEEDIDVENLEIVKDTMYYQIETNHVDYILITLK